MTPKDDNTAHRRRVLAYAAVPDTRRAVVPWVRSTPGTHVWLAVIALNSVVLAAVPSQLRELLLHHNSTNLMELRKHPIRVLIVSALWIQSPVALALCAVLYEVLHAPAERWLGTRRWLLVAVTAHIGATLVSQQAVLVGIHLGVLPTSLAHTVDVGVSYGLAGVAGVLVHHIPGRRCLRWLGATALLGLFGWFLAADRTFTDLGHFCAVLIGLGLYRLTVHRGRDRGVGRPRGHAGHGGHGTGAGGTGAGGTGADETTDGTRTDGTGAGDWVGGHMTAALRSCVGRAVSRYRKAVPGPARSRRPRWRW
jgi:hypothetical protein